MYPRVLGTSQRAGLDAERRFAFRDGVAEIPDVHRLSFVGVSGILWVMFPFPYAPLVAAPSSIAHPRPNPAETLRRRLPDKIGRRVHVLRVVPRGIRKMGGATDEAAQ